MSGDSSDQGAGQAAGMPSEYFEWVLTPSEWLCFRDASKFIRDILEVRPSEDGGEGVKHRRSTVVIRFCPPFVLTPDRSIRVKRALAKRDPREYLAFTGEEWDCTIVLAEYLDLGSVLPSLAVSLLNNHTGSRKAFGQCMSSLHARLGFVHPTSQAVWTAIEQRLGFKPSICNRAEIRDLSYGAVTRWHRNCFRVQTHQARMYLQKVRTHVCQFCTEEVNFVEERPLKYTNMIVLPCCGGLLHRNDSCVLHYLSLKCCIHCLIPLAEGCPDYEAEWLGRLFYRSYVQDLNGVRDHPQFQYLPTLAQLYPYFFVPAADPVPFEDLVLEPPLENAEPVLVEDWGDGEQVHYYLG